MRLALLVAAVLGCAATPAPAPEPRRAPPPAADFRPPQSSGPSALDDMLRHDLDDDHAFPWSASRPLTWNDFQGQPPAEGPEGAKSAYSLSSVWKCRGSNFEFRVIAAFRPRQSWVKAAVLNDDVARRTVLGHEQTHFDLAEVHARRMRQAFAVLAVPCRRSDAELGAVVQRLAEEEKDEQRRYDDETDHGLLAPQQAAWTAQTRRRLELSR